MSRAALAGACDGGAGVSVTPVVHALFLAGAFLPLVAMLSALFAAVWLRGSAREREAVAPRSHQR